MKRIAIIGGGMAGLAAAHTLHKAGHTNWLLLEGRDRLGGKIVTDREAGFVIEGGPDSFITQKPGGLELCRELGLENELIPCQEAAQKIYVLVDGRLQALPAGFRLTAPTKFWPFIRSPLFSWSGKLRIGLDWFIPPVRHRDDESVAAFITRRLGREAADKIGGPLMAGIYVADPERLSVLATFPMFREMERKHGSLIRALRAAARRPASRTPMFMSLRNGMGQLVETIIPPLQDHCHTATSVHAVTRQSGAGYMIHTHHGAEHVDSVIFATPLFETAGILGALAPDTLPLLSGMRYVSTATISFGFRLPLEGMALPLDAFGFVVPASEKRQLLACTWSSIKFPHRAPDGHVLFRVFIGGAKQEHLFDHSDSALITIAQSELGHILGLHNDPVLTRVYRWPKGNPQYDVGHLDRMAVLTNHLNTLPGVYLAGSGIHGIGLPDCIRSGRAAAQAALALD